MQAGKHVYMQLRNHVFVYAGIQLYKHIAVLHTLQKRNIKYKCF
jgi:hypothetical protein